MELPKYIKQEAGTTPVLIMVVVLGVVAFFLLSGIGGFKKQPESSLYQKPESQAANKNQTVATIVLNQVNQTLKLGDTITFTTTYPKTLKNPEVYVVCYQNNVIVYGQLDHPEAAFVLGGGSSLWKNDPAHSINPADCAVKFYDYGPMHNENIVQIAPTIYFSAQGSSN